MSEDQGALFGDLDGLFASIDTVPVTPVAEVRLVPGPAVECDTYTIYIAGRYGDRPYDPDAPCDRCGRAADAHSVPCGDCGEMMAPGVDHDCASLLGGPVFDHGDQLGPNDEAGRLELAADLAEFAGQSETAAEIRARLAARVGSPAVEDDDDDDDDGPEDDGPGRGTGHDPAQVREMFAGLGWSTTSPTSPAASTTSTGPWVIVPCSGKKRNRPAPAVDLYTGSFFRAALAAARAITTDDRIRILSGRHGLVELSTVIAPYDQRITDPQVGRWATISRQLHAIDADRTGRFVALLPNDYAAALVDPVRPQLTRTYTNPLAGSRGIGDQLHRLAEIARTGALPTPPSNGGTPAPVPAGEVTPTSHDEAEVTAPRYDPHAGQLFPPAAHVCTPGECAILVGRTDCCGAAIFDDDDPADVCCCARDELHEPADDDPAGPDCITCGEPVEIDITGDVTKWGPLHDACDEPDDDPADRWTVENPPTIADLIEQAHAPWKIGACLAADDLADAAAALRWEGGTGGPRGHLNMTPKGIYLSADGGRALVMTWPKMAAAIRDAATDDDRRELAAALEADRAIDDEHDADPRPWIPAATLKTADTGTIHAHDLADAAWGRRSDARYRRGAECAAHTRTIVARIAAATAGPAAGALF